MGQTFMSLAHCVLKIFFLEKCLIWKRGIIQSNSYSGFPEEYFSPKQCSSPIKPTKKSHHIMLAKSFNRPLLKLGWNIYIQTILMKIYTWSHKHYIILIQRLLFKYITKLHVQHGKCSKTQKCTWSSRDCICSNFYLTNHLLNVSLKGKTKHFHHHTAYDYSRECKNRWSVTAIRIAYVVGLLKPPIVECRRPK